MKLYSAQAATEVALEAVQLFGGNGYMAEYQVEQLARDAKVLQIYAGTDEMQVRAIARALLSRSWGPEAAGGRSLLPALRIGLCACAGTALRAAGARTPTTDR